jgi:hypothetical protein
MTGVRPLKNEYGCGPENVPKTGLRAINVPDAPSPRFVHVLFAILTENGVPDVYGLSLKHTTEPLKPLVVVYCGTLPL